MLEKIMPSVVSISVEGSTPVTARQMPDQLKQFFGQNSPLCQGGGDEGSAPAQEKFQALGAGVIIDADKGYVVINNHGVNDASKIQVQLNDGRKFDAKLIGINTAILAPDGGNIGIGFAIPSNYGQKPDQTNC